MHDLHGGFCIIQTKIESQEMKSVLYYGVLSEVEGGGGWCASNHCLKSSYCPPCLIIAERMGTSNSSHTTILVDPYLR